MIGPRLGILLGKAVGDALGAGTEFQTPDQITRRHGTVTGYVQGVNQDFAPGEFTDDTHMALCILGAYWDRAVRGDDLLVATLKRFQAWRAARPPDIGNATQGALLSSRQHGLSGGFLQWEQSGYASAGNGGLMRAATSAVAGSRGEALRTEAIQLSMLTHPDPRSLGACRVLVVALEAILDGADVVDAWKLGVDELAKAKLDVPIQEQFGGHRAALIRERLPEARKAVRAAVEHGLTGAWRSQSGFVIHTLEAAVAASLAPSYLEGILPIVARGDDSDSVAAVAGAVLGARGLLPPDELIDGLRCNFAWPTWPPDEVRGWPALAAFVPPRPDAAPTSPDDEDAEEVEFRRFQPLLPPFEFDEIAPNVYAGRAPLFQREVWQLRAAGITHILDLREEREWATAGYRGRSAIAEIDALGLTRLHVPVTDVTAPMPHHLDDAVAFIEAALHVGGTVYLHCRAGMQRTASVAGAWYARQQRCSVMDAMRQLRQRRPAFEPLPDQMQAAQRWVSAHPYRS
ncbi:MAG: ADP-ribosylglycohydrolase family protein [Chloroflexi bacterium]|nr:ADP-ribosylglycohydrolase family protein [Chloroflexota bacterium]